MRGFHLWALRMGWFKQLFGKRDAVPLDPALWSRLMQGLPFLAHLDASEQTALRALAGAFLARKTISAAGGLELDEDIVAAIAAQACLPVLHLGLDMFDDFSEVIVYPGEFHVEREFIDADGVVHDVSGALSGEAMPGGPVVVSWEDVGLGADDARAAQDRPAYNVVIHEFAHKLDLAAGDADGLPRLHPRLHAQIDPDEWCAILDDAHADFCAMVDRLEARFPRHLDPESEAGRRIYDSLPLDAYGADDPAEFFAVASEAYFVAPQRLRSAFAALHALLDRYYRPPLRAAQPSPRSRSDSQD